MDKQRSLSVRWCLTAAQAARTNELESLANAKSVRTRFGFCFVGFAVGLPALDIAINRGSSCVRHVYFVLFTLVCCICRVSCRKEGTGEKCIGEPVTA